MYKGGGQVSMYRDGGWKGRRASKAVGRKESRWEFR